LSPVQTAVVGEGRRRRRMKRRRWSIILVGDVIVAEVEG